MLKKLFLLIKENGPWWTLLYIVRIIFLKTVNSIEALMLKIERRCGLWGKHSLTNQLNSVRDNYIKWNGVPWQTVGDVWTNDAKHFKNQDPTEWKNQIIENYLNKYMAGAKNILEVGPGGGRWTELLLKTPGQLKIADISDTSLEMCKSKFKDFKNINFYLIDPSAKRFLSTDFVAPNTLDYIWSYDVFVHINPSDINEYIKEFAEILKPGGIAVIHHAGNYKSEAERLRYFRSNIDHKAFNHLLKKYNLKLIEQDFNHAHFPGDVISVFKK